MIELYPEIRQIHIWAAIASGSLLLLRGLPLLAGRNWGGVAALRYLGYTIDGTLLTVALMLTTIIRQYPFVHGWLTVKALLVVVYIVLGVVAFLPRLSNRTRIASWLAALGVFACIYSVARSHHPLGFLHGVPD